jgi:hypothetical protein
MGGVIQESSSALAERWRKHSRPLARPSSGVPAFAAAVSSVLLVRERDMAASPEVEPIEAAA